MLTLALLSSLFVGISLGLLGSGGSILTVPILVYILHRPEKLAIAESLAIVGCIAFAAALPYAARSQIHWKSVLLFGVPGMFGAYVGALASGFISGEVQLTLFAIVMMVVGVTMSIELPSFAKRFSSQSLLWLTGVEGFVVGCLTGFLGVGGGFLTVPALVLFSHLPTLLAIGTSLVIIAMNAFTGFIQQRIALRIFEMQVDWEVIGIISIVGILGCLSGSFIAHKVSHFHLKKIFGIYVFSIGIYILLNQL
jgi:uncharacterized protein